MLNLISRYIIFPLKYSISGLQFAIRDRAFRFETILGTIFIPILLMIFKNHLLYFLLVWMSYCGILTSELLNCAVEKTIDYISPEKHFLAKQAKDIASAAVFLMIINFFIVLIFSISLVLKST